MLRSLLHQLARGLNRRPSPIRKAVRARTWRPVLEELESRFAPAVTVSNLNGVLAAQADNGFTVVATGLENPRGLAFGPDGKLYVAEGGRSTNSLPPISGAQQVPFPIGPYTGGYNGGISRVDVRTGARTTVVSGLPSSQTNPVSGSDVGGVSAVQFIDGTLYGMEAGGGRSHAIPNNGNPVYSDNTIFRVNRDGSVSLVADLGTYLQTHPVANPEPSVPPGDFEPDGTWYGMVAVGDALYATEPNHQEVDRITPDGHISRVIDMSVQFPAPNDWAGPTGIAYHHAAFYVGTLGQFPVTPGTESIFQVTRSGHLRVAASGLTTVLGVAFDHQGRLYALETDTVPGFPGPAAAGSGKVVRVNRDGTLTTIAQGLTFPTAMTLGPDNALYVSNIGFGVPDNPLLMPDPGQIVRIDLGRDRVGDSGPVGDGAAAGLDSKPAAGAPGGSRDVSMFLGDPFARVVPPWQTALQQVPSVGLAGQGLVPPSAWKGARAQDFALAAALEELAPGHSAAQDWTLAEFLATNLGTLALGDW